MAIYSAGRRRTMIILLLTSILLITLDLRGNAVFNAARSGFGYALRPFEIAGDVITKPIARMWNGISEIDDLEAENARLQQQIDQQRSEQIAWQNALIENRRLRALLDLESLAELPRVTGEIIGSSPSNFDQRVEIDRGSLDGIKVGMPVVNDAGLVGKITNVNPETAIVMLVTDPQYHVPVKVVAEVFPTPSTVPPSTVPSGLAVDDVTTTLAPTTTTTSTTSTTVPDDDSSDDPLADSPGDAGVDEPGSAIAPFPTTGTTTTSTTTTTLAPIEVTRETGDLNGFGADRLPRVRFIADSPQFGRVAEGDAVLTAGGSVSLAPPNIPIGKVANVIPRAGTAGLELEVELNVDLGRLNFLTVILYQPPTELVE
jgi:rod shape-determining protein MreC